MTVYTYHLFFSYFSADGNLGCFHVLAIVNNAAMNITVPISFLTTVFTGRMPRSGIAGSYGNFIFILLRNLNTILHSGCSNLQSLQLCRRIHFSTHHLQHLLFIDFFNDGNSEEYEVISHCSFDFHFSIDQ